MIRPTGAEPIEIWAQTALYELGCIYLEWGLLDDARRALNRADERAEATQTLTWRSRIRVALARVMWAQGEREAALDEIERAIGFANQLGTLQLVRDAGAQQARFWLSSNRLALAERWADSCDLDPYMPPEYERQIEHLTYVRLLLQQNRPELALAILQRIDQLAVASGRQGDRVEILLLTALAHKACDQATEAFTALHDALTMGSLGGYLRTFVAEEERLTPLLAPRLGAHQPSRLCQKHHGRDHPGGRGHPAGAVGHAGCAERAGDRGLAAGGRGAVQPRHRAAPLYQREDGQDPPEQHHGQAGRRQPHPGRRPGPLPGGGLSHASRWRAGIWCAGEGLCGSLARCSG